METNKSARKSKNDFSSAPDDFAGLTFAGVLSALSSSSASGASPALTSSTRVTTSSIIADETLRLERRLREAEAEIASLKNVNELQKDRIAQLERDLVRKTGNGVRNISNTEAPISSRAVSAVAHVGTDDDDSACLATAVGDASSFDRDLQNYYETRCRNLEKMVLEMHRWFSDYDLVWIGDKEEEEGEDEEGELARGMKELTDEEAEEFRVKNAALDLDSLVAAFPDGDDRENDDDHGDDTSTPILDLFWFANGLKISSYPMMRYDDSTWGRQTLEEIAEGFLPSRLQFDFPEGVDLRSRDRRGFVFEDAKATATATATSEGGGRRHPTVRELQARGLLPSVDHPALDRTRKLKKKKSSSTEFIPTILNRGSAQSRNKSPTSRYLEKVPRVVIDKDGDIHRPRDDLKDALTGRSIRGGGATPGRIPVRIRAYHRRDEHQVLRLHLLPHQTVDRVKTFCEEKLGVEKGKFDESFELVSDEKMKQFEMSEEELAARDLRVWNDGAKRVGEAGWSRDDVDDEAPIRDKLICLHLRRAGKDLA